MATKTCINYKKIENTTMLVKIFKQKKNTNLQQKLIAHLLIIKKLYFIKKIKQKYSLKVISFSLENQFQTNKFRTLRLETGYIN